MNATAEALHTDFERGTRDGRALRELDRPVPALDGGAYAVGFLFGYHGEPRRSARQVHAS